jgi:hypothetical protein
MSDNWKLSVNQAVGPVQIQDIGNYVHSLSPFSNSPIDRFYKSTRKFLQVGSQNFIAANPFIGPLLLVGIVSSTENYFRDLLSMVIHICPLCKKISADNSIKFGSVLWHKGINIERGALEHISFADHKNIKRQVKKFTGYQIKDNGPSDTVIEEYSKVCELRHGIVHSNLEFAGINAIKLELLNISSPSRIKVEYTELQECASVCTTLVASFNTEFFEEMAKRWAVEWPNSPSWDNQKANIKFREIWNLFHSSIDESEGVIPSQMSVVKCRNRVKRTFNI